MATVDAEVLAQQAAYYRERAAEYDEWWYRLGRYNRGTEYFLYGVGERQLAPS